MKTTVLSQDDLRTLVRRVGIDRLMDELIERLQSALEAFDPAATDTPARTGFHYDTPAPGLVEWMPLHVADSVDLKVVGYHPESPARHGLPTILSTLCRFDTRTGHLEALADGTFLTALRTGAASAVAARLLAREGAVVLGLIGCGAQAVTQLHGLSRVLDVREVRCFDVDPAATESLRRRCAAFLDPDVPIAVHAPDAIAAEVDVLCVATSVDVGAGPVFPMVETRPWLHVNGVGSDLPGKTELPRPLLESSLIVADTLVQARVEGECQQLDDLSAVRELADVARDPASVRDARERRTVFDSTGWALEDHVALELALHHARALGLGTEVQLESVTADPRDPYEAIAPAAALAAAARGGAGRAEGRAAR